MVGARFPCATSPHFVNSERSLYTQLLYGVISEFAFLQKLRWGQKFWDLSGAKVFTGCKSFKVLRLYLVQKFSQDAKVFTR